ncbi:MAG TPA: hypothetical protein VFS29_12645 [Motilibacteraceae bacterium]|nr:hypothetical protein [Motilibacteraceae bacterium]
MSPDAAAVRAAAEALIAAVTEHLSACERRSGEADPAVQRAYDAVRQAAEHYDDVLFDAYEEVTPFEFAAAPVSEVVEGNGVPTRVGVYVRRDYTVRDVEELIAAGERAASGTADEDEETEDTEVVSAGQAVYALIDTFGLDGLDEVAEDSGLEPVGGTVWVLSEAADDDTIYDGPFDDVDEDRLLLRLDEVVEG